MISFPPRKRWSIRGVTHESESFFKYPAPSGLPFDERRWSSLEPSRRSFLAGLGGAAVLTAFSGGRALAQAPESALNVARVAVPTSLTMASENKISALNDGFTPANSLDRSHALYAIWGEPSTGTPHQLGSVRVDRAGQHQQGRSLLGSRSPPPRRIAGQRLATIWKRPRVTGFFIGMEATSFRSHNRRGWALLWTRSMSPPSNP